MTSKSRTLVWAPGVPLAVVEGQRPFAVLNGYNVVCPLCGSSDQSSLTAIHSKKWKKKIDLTLLVHPDWLEVTPREAQTTKILEEV